MQSKTNQRTRNRILKLLVGCEVFLRGAKEAAESGRLTDWERGQLLLAGQTLSDSIWRHKPAEWGRQFPSVDGPITEGERLANALDAICKAVESGQLIDACDLQAIGVTIERLRVGGSTTTKKNRTRRRSKLEKHRKMFEAMTLVNDHPEWSDRKIAREIGVNPSTLSRWPEYQTAADMARGDKSKIRKGHVIRDPKTGLSDVEAYDD